MFLITMSFLHTACIMVYGKILELVWGKNGGKCYLAMRVMKHKVDAIDLGAT